AANKGDLKAAHDGAVLLGHDDAIAAITFDKAEGERVGLGRREILARLAELVVGQHLDDCLQVLVTGVAENHFAHSTDFLASTSSGTAITTRSFSITGTFSRVKASMVVSPSGRSISITSPAPKLWIARTLPSLRSSWSKTGTPIRSA